jgi:hypothetical protein
MDRLLVRGTARVIRRRTGEGGAHQNGDGEVILDHCDTSVETNVLSKEREDLRARLDCSSDLFI